MILQVKNNELVPLTLNSGVAGIPVGTIIASMATSGNSNWLLCDGSTYDTDKYSLLYAVLGTNVLPDLRECVLVGAGQNSTDSIATHDTYLVGEFKDDQIQNHGHTVTTQGNGYHTWGYGSAGGVTGSAYAGGFYKPSVGSSSVNSGRRGSVTHGKQKGVNYFIKATTSAEESDGNAYEDYSLCKTWADITDDFSLTAVANYSDGAIEKVLYNAATGRIKVFTTSTSTFSASDTHSYNLDYTGSDPNISFGDYTMVNTTLGNIQGGCETSYRVESATRLYIHSFNRNTGNAWSAGRKLCSLITL